MSLRYSLHMLPKVQMEFNIPHHLEDQVDFYHSFEKVAHKFGGVFDVIIILLHRILWYRDEYIFRLHLLLYFSILTFDNRCLSAIGSGNQLSRFAGWMQLSAEAAWPPQSTTSVTMCAQDPRRLMIMIYDKIHTWIRPINANILSH